MDLAELQRRFHPLFGGTGGIDSWISLTPEPTPATVVNRLSALAERPLTRAQFNQLLVLSHEAGMSEGFFEYYWRILPPRHPYPTESIAGYQPDWLGAADPVIRDLDHLKWGFYRFYVDALLFFGSIRNAYRYLRQLDRAALESFFEKYRFDTEQLRERGPALALKPIARESRHLISEMACKSYEPADPATATVAQVVRGAYEEHFVAARTKTTVGDIVKYAVGLEGNSERKVEFGISAADLMEREIETSEDLAECFAEEGKRFHEAREAASTNTELYLSMVGDLDVYVATSMREKQQFLDIADFCSEVFGATALQDLLLRYFDPTISAAASHEDKGVIECLMVKCARALVYVHAPGESWGKDVEAAMALSQGKPVIMFCTGPEKERMFRDVHPLTRLIDFDSGVVVGAMVTATAETVVELLRRLFSNEMRYSVEQPKEGYLVLTEELSQCTVRLQTSSKLLRETFWNYYHGHKEYAASAPFMSSRP